MLEESSLARGAIPDYEQRGCGRVVRTTSRFTDPYGKTVFLVIDNEIALLITAAVNKWIFKRYDPTPSPGKAFSFNLFCWRLNACRRGGRWFDRSSCWSTRRSRRCLRSFLNGRRQGTSAEQKKQGGAE